MMERMLAGLIIIVSLALRPVLRKESVIFLELINKYMN